MRWLVDECVDAPRAAALRQAGRDVTEVADIARRANDTVVMEIAETEGRLLLTEDKDFGDLVFRQAKPVPGLVLLRIGTQQRHVKAIRFFAAVGQFGDALFGCYPVVEERRLRSRKLRPSGDDNTSA